MVLQSENLTPSTRSDMEPAFYVFDNTAGPGFVIVAGDDVAAPILAYSFEHEFSADEMPPNLKSWMADMRDEINYAREHNLQAPEAVTRAWASTRAGTPVVEYETALWDQGMPYNNLCPRVNRVTSYTGCTATALSIIMNYHQWPERGTGVLPAYTTASYQADIESIELGHAYDWGNMLMEYNTGEYSTQEAEAVATLMRDCAVGLQSDFGPLMSSGTGAYVNDIPAFLVNYMGYDKGCHVATRADYNTADWNQLIRNELDNGRLVLLGGQAKDGGHAFVLQGYDTDNYFNVNWGWSGTSNGYYLLSALNPGEQGTGSFEGGYNSGQQALIGVQKDAGGDYVESLGMQNYPQYGATGLKIIEGEPVQNEPFKMRIGFLYNNGNVPFTGDALMAMTDKEGTIVEELFGITYANEPLELNYGSIIEEEMTITSPILPGHRIRIFYRTAKKPEWTLIRANDEEGCVWDLVLADEYTIEETTKLTFSKEDRIIRLEVKDGVTASLQAADSTDHSDLCQQEGNSISIDTSGLPGGRYVLTLTKLAERKTVTFVLPEAE